MNESQKPSARAGRLSGAALVAALAPLLWAGDTLAQTAKTTNYTYDALGRLTFVNDSVNGNRDYDYDAAGNRRNVAVGTASDGASEPVAPPPPPPSPPAMPTNLSSQYMNDCNWVASWSAPGGQTSYQFKETANAERTVAASAVSTGVACPLGNPNGNKPSYIKACNANGCSAAAYF